METTRRRIGVLHAIRVATRHRTTAMGAAVLLLGGLSTDADAEGRRGTRIEKLVIDLENGRVEVSGWSMDHEGSTTAVPMRTGDASPSTPGDQETDAGVATVEATTDQDAASAPDSEAEPAEGSDADSAVESVTALAADTPSEADMDSAPDPDDAQEDGFASASTTGVESGEQSEGEPGAVLAEGEVADSTFSTQASAIDAEPDAESAEQPADAGQTATSSVAFEGDDVIVATHEKPAPPAVDIGAVAIASRKTARCGESVMLSGEASHSSAGSIVAYEWDFDGDGVYGDAVGALVEYSLTSLPTTNGVYRPIPIGLRVVDSMGNTATTKVDIIPGPKADNQSPQVHITPRFTWVERQNQEDVIIDATGTVDPDGSCDHLRYEWTCESAGTGACRTDAMELTGPVLRIPWQRLEADTTYFWKLTVTDNAGAQAIGSAVIESLRSLEPPKPVIEVNGRVRPDDGLRANCIYMADTHEPIWCAD